MTASARALAAALASALLALAAGCAPTASRAPVVERSSGAADTAAPTAPGRYVVRKQDTLYSIAWRHNLDYQALAAANRIEPPYTIYPGDELQLAARPASPIGRRSQQAVPAARQAREREARRRTSRRASAPSARPLRRPAVASPSVPAPVEEAAPQANPAVPSPATPKPPAKPKPTATPRRPTAPALPPATSGWRPPVAAKPTRRFGGASKGYDYALPPATMVRAAAPGEVVYAGPGLGGFRHLVIVKASERYLVAYGINVPPKLKEGETVAMGATVAEIGSGGAAAGRFHFEIRDRGKPVDPGPLLGGA